MSSKEVEGVGLGTGMNGGKKRKKQEGSGQITYYKDLCEHKLRTQPWDWEEGSAPGFIVTKVHLKIEYLRKNIKKTLLW